MSEPLASLLNAALGALLGFAFWAQLVLRQAYTLPPFHTKEHFIWLGRLVRVLSAAISLGVLFVWAWQFGKMGQHWHWLALYFGGAAASFAVLRPCVLRSAKALRPILLPVPRRQSVAQPFRSSGTG